MRSQHAEFCDRMAQLAMYVEDCTKSQQDPSANVSAAAATCIPSCVCPATCNTVFSVASMLLYLATLATLRVAENHIWLHAPPPALQRTTAMAPLTRSLLLDPQLCEVASQLVYQGMQLVASWRSAVLQLDAVRLMYKSTADSRWGTALLDP